MKKMEEKTASTGQSETIAEQEKTAKNMKQIIFFSKNYSVVHNLCLPRSPQNLTSLFLTLMTSSSFRNNYKKIILRVPRCGTLVKAFSQEKSKTTKESKKVDKRFAAVEKIASCCAGRRQSVDVKMLCKG